MIEAIRNSLSANSTPLQQPRDIIPSRNIDEQLLEIKNLIKEEIGKFRYFFDSNNIASITARQKNLLTINDQNNQAECLEMVSY